MEKHGKFVLLEQQCREWGYHGICPEGLERIAASIERGGEEDDVCREYRRFMAGLRVMLAPK